MTDARPSRWAVLTRRRALAILVAALATAALLTVALIRGCEDEREPEPAKPAVETATPEAATPTEAPSPTSTAAATPSPTVTKPAAGEPEVSPGGDDVPPLAVITISFREPPPETEGAALVSIEPRIEGVFVWADERTLLVQPAYPGWLRGQRYRLTVSGEAAGTAGDHVHEFTVGGQLEVASAIPADGDTEVPTEAQILVQFNRSVAPLTVLEEGPGPSVLEFDPPLAGAGEWLNTSLYRFIPTDLQPSTEYRVRIPAGLTSAADGVLQEDFTWSFTTIRPAVTSIWPEQGAFYVEPDTVVRVTFNQAMARASVEEAVTLRRASGEPVAVAFEWDESGASLALRPEEPLALSTSYDIVVPPGLAGARGLASTAGREVRFTTIDYPKLLRTYPADGETNANPWYGIRLHYNNPMERSSFEGRVSISGIDMDDIWVDTYSYWDEYSSDIYVSAPLEYDSEYTVRIAEGVRDRGGRTLPASEFTFATGSPPDPAPYVTLAVPGEFTTFSAARQQRVYLHAQHTGRVQFRLYPLTSGEADQLIERGSIDEWKGRDYIIFWPQGEPLRNWSKPVAEELRDARRIYSTTMGEGGLLPEGDYLLVASTEEAVSLRMEEGYSRDEALMQSREKVVFSVVDTVIVTKITYRQLLVWTLDYETGEPLADMGLTAGNLRGRTDSDGLARFPIPIPTGSYWDPYGHYIVRTAGEGRHGVVSTRWDEGASPWQVNVPTATFRPQMLGNLYTDRPIYRPGETVYYKGVVRSEDDATYSIPTNSTALGVVIQDPRYQQVSRTPVELNDLGTFAGEFVIPEGARTGDYTIELRPADSYSAITWISFTVAEYRAPEFEIEMETGRLHYIDGEAIDATTHARYFFGSPVPQARVEWSTSSWSTPFWAEGYWRYSFNDYDSATSSYSSPPDTSGIAQTDALGAGRFDVAAVAGGPGRTERVTISSTVIEPSGQAVSGSISAIVHPAAWYVGVRPDSYVATTDEAEPIQILTVDPEGRVVPEKRVTLRIYQREWVTTKEQSASGQRVYRSEAVDTEIAVRSLTTDGGRQWNGQLYTANAGNVPAGRGNSRRPGPDRSISALPLGSCAARGARSAARILAGPQR